MSAPRFGFSAGDFISAVKLTNDVSNALKDVGGAAENYLEVPTELELLGDILSELQKGRDGAVVEQSNNPFVKHAKTQVKLKS
ncbi:Ff.00g053960.m01.CDS01 [Fusarium sp. VM40]|nr:Ff.00g053960.m01.CDS01 [Fusarium sp. VM40]